MIDILSCIEWCRGE